MTTSIAVTDNLSGIKDRLHDEAKRLDQQRATLKKQLKQTDLELRRVHAAMRALGTEPHAQVRRGDGRATALTTGDVIQLIEEVLRQDGTMLVNVLRTQVEARARATGRTLIGFHLRFEKALNHESFEVVGADGGNVVSLRPPAKSDMEQVEHTASRTAHNASARS